jgi:hypothetical protein
MVQQPLLGQGLIIVEASGSHSGTTGSVELWTSDQPDGRALPDNIQHHMRQTSMSPAGFEHAIPASERLQTHALDNVAYFVIYLFVYLVKLVSENIVVKSNAQIFVVT